MSDLYPDLGRDGRILDIAAAADVMVDDGVGPEAVRISTHAQPDTTGVAHTHDINTEFIPHSRKAPPAPKTKKEKKNKGGKKKSNYTLMGKHLSMRRRILGGSRKKHGARKTRRTKHHRKGRKGTRRRRSRTSHHVSKKKRQRGGLKGDSWSRHAAAVANQQDMIMDNRRRAGLPTFGMYDLLNPAASGVVKKILKKEK
jgi:hypothetical protein